MNAMGIARSIAVVLVGFLLLAFIDKTLEQTLVMAMANAMPKDEASYVAVRNQTNVLAIIVVTHAFAALLTGYVIGKLAGTLEVQHAAATAALVTLALINASANSNAQSPPTWALLTMALITPPALIAGAYVRGQARLIRMEREQS